jgi:hypothetical protein
MGAAMRAPRAARARSLLRDCGVSPILHGPATQLADSQRAAVKRVEAEALLNMELAKVCMARTTHTRLAQSGGPRPQSARLAEAARAARHAPTQTRRRRLPCVLAMGRACGAVLSVVLSVC